jgi:hypothetical protein
MNANKEAHFIYKQKSSAGTLDTEDVARRKDTKKVLRTLMRKEEAKHQTKLRSNIMSARREDSKLFHKIVKRQRGKSCVLIPQLEVQGITHRGENDIRKGWKTHFETLTTSTSSPAFDNKYKDIVDYDIDIIKDIFREEYEPITETSINEVTKAIYSLNMGKSPDIYGITAENIVYGGEQLIITLCEILNAVLHHQTIPDVLKAGTITPVFKKKGSKLDARNYRGITVLPVIAKILELVLRNRLRIHIDQHQNPMQRGFTCGASPLFCALIIEEFIRETTGKKCASLTAYLDAKTAFDVVDHNSLLRKLYHMGIGGGLWNILYSFYEDASSVVKWMGKASNEFTIEQGVRQGGILSADLYKVYINQLLDRLYHCGFGAKIGDIVCNAPTCADDLSTLSDSDQELQILCSIANDYSLMERYELQPKKSVVLPYIKKRAAGVNKPIITLGDQQMPVVDKTTHVGLVRTPDNSPTAAITENLQKARRTLYSLMSAGLHGENGLDPETCIHLLRTYVIPILIYGLEIYLPSPISIRPLEMFLKKVLKQILSIPTTTADPAPFILSGLVPVEALIHLRALSLFGNIVRLDNSSVEKRIAYRQLTIHGQSGGSWFSDLSVILAKYKLPSPMEIIRDPKPKYHWKTQTTRAVYDYWEKRIKQQAETYSSLDHLSTRHYNPGRVHPVLYITDTQTQTREAARLTVKTKLVTGTYSLQSNRAAFNKLEVDPTCLLCKTSPETLEHFLLYCEKLENIRVPILQDISDACGAHIDFSMLSPEEKVNLILDVFSTVNTLRKDTLYLTEIDRHTRRLCFALHYERHSFISVLPTKKKYGL